MTAEADFAAFIKPLKLRYFTAEEILYRSSNPELRALWVVPERSLWPNIVLPCLIADRLRHEVGLPMRISSGYRPSAYNLHRLVRGGKISQHQAFTALDLQVIEADENGNWEWTEGTTQSIGDHQHLADLVRSWRGELFRVPGIHHRRQIGTRAHGLIPFEELPTWTRKTNVVDVHSQIVEFHGGVGSYTKFVHIDTRGIDATWSGP